ncbi:DUF3459 domain-containing protein [Microbacterium sp. B24]|uniref:DUF3459 domain-containing protein n=1 Tax=Microbacterium sp. B24 TaxID=95616 RepID=UPI000402BD49|nr:DUF3459 domain-containing protein [Microbacterium sp. B24]
MTDTTLADEDVDPTPKLGRKRDHSRDPEILARPELTDPDQRGHAAESVGDGRWILHRDTASVYVNLSPEPWTVELVGREIWLATTAHEQRTDAGPLVLSADSAAVVGAREQAPSL